MNTRNLFLLSALCSLSSLAADWTVSIDPSVRLGAIKPVNAVNCGPCNPNSAQGKAYKAANIPFARTHDMNHSWTYGGPYVIDISAIFPNFDADETNSENYDFALTDRALDFYSWHRYCNDARESSRYGREVREYLDKYGYKKTESIYNEWNYVKGWSGGDWRYSRQVESSVFNQKAAAYAAATMIECQNSPIDMAMYYDVRTYGGMNMLFDSITHQPLRGYYPFYAWGRMLKDYPEQIKCTLVPDGDRKIGEIEVASF